MNAVTPQINIEMENHYFKPADDDKSRTTTTVFVSILWSDIIKKFQAVLSFWGVARWLQNQ